MEAAVQGLRKVFMTLNLLSPQCFDSLVVNMELTNFACHRMLLSRALGILIIAGATCVKLPQIFKIVGNKSAKGISFVGTLLELLAVTANGAYSFSKGFPFAAYGEAITLGFQTSVVAALILYYGGNSLLSLLFTSLYAAAVFAITSPGYVPQEVLWYGQAANIPMVVLGKLIQVVANYRQGHTGQLSAITIFMITLGSLARIFTSVQETGDIVVISTYLCSSFVNLILAGQVVYYWDLDEDKKQKQSKKKRA